jgi:hypothetical protein
VDCFVVRRRMWPVFRLFSRNPLIRTSDRIEATVVTLAALVVILAAACAEALGMVVHDARARMYTEQARTRHPIVAIALEDSKKTATPETTAATVYARWEVNGAAHTGVLSWDDDVRAGDPLQIWVDAGGNRVGQPSPVSRAGTDAVSVAIVTWLSVVLAVTGTVCAVRVQTSRTRDAQWERETRCLFNDEDYTNSSQ